MFFLKSKKLIVRIFLKEIVTAKYKITEIISQLREIYVVTRYKTHLVCV